MTKKDLLIKISNASAQEADRIYNKLKITDIFQGKEKEDLMFHAAQRELYMQTFGANDKK